MSSQLATLLTDVTAYYLGSRDFNGLPGYSCVRDYKVSLDDLKNGISPLVSAGSLALNFGNVHVNPHIRAFPDIPADEQLALLAFATDASFVLYPTPTHLRQVVDPRHYDGRPFSLRLAQGEAQLSYLSFDPAVLEHYRRDPRYDLWTNDVQATLSVGNDAYDSPTFPDKHKVLIQHFGFSYLADRSRAVAVFLTDLARLTPEHQQIWNAMQVYGDYRLHPDYYRAAIEGDFGEKVSLSEAFMIELETINKMCGAIGWPQLFRDIPPTQPPELAFLLRPTRLDYGEFLLVADKLLSENLNPAFFPADIPKDTLTVRADGVTVAQPKGTIALLEEWFRTCFKIQDDPAILTTMIATLRRVRKLRQQPAHSLKPNEYDLALFVEQRQLFGDAYEAVRTIRMVFANHPKAASVDMAMDPRVHAGDIWTW